MREVNIKPLRKPEETMLDNDEYIRRAKIKVDSSKILLSKQSANRFDGFDEGSSLATIFSKARNFSSFKNISDYYCASKKTELVSDESGRVADILLTVPAYYEKDEPGIVVDPSDKRHLTKLIELMYSIENRRHFTILCQPNQVQEVEGWFSTLGIASGFYFISISTFNYSIWAQDAYVALKDQSGQPILCEGVHFPRYDDPTIADDIAAQTDKVVMQSYLYFQGGNVLEVGDYVLIGKDYIQENLGRAHLESEAKILEAFESVFGKKVLSIGRDTLIPQQHREYLGGGYYQPIFHIDMYITPTGKKSVNGKDIVAVASPRLGREAIGEKQRSTDYDIYFDEAASQLGNYFEVVRVPILPSRIVLKSSPGKARYYYLSYNNSVVENYSGGSNIYLPTFSQDVSLYKTSQNVLEYEGDIEKREMLDSYAKNVWEKLGFNVLQMDGLEDLAIGWGSVHCITKTLVRTQ